MEDMKTDMAGSAVVVGLLRCLAQRKAKVNVVGVVGLVENMPSGTAQRPGDVVKSMSGQTIEVINTDAEGRLVLADALHYTRSKFKPKFIVDLATLTGAIIVALADVYAGLFSNDDALAKEIESCGISSGERVWRLPLGAEYDEMINSDIADMKNVGSGRGAGSTTAAQFLKRFIGDEKGETKWVHLDIAGVAWKGKGDALAVKGATGFGLRLLNELVGTYEGK
jgi:leucyl aminopeptidase